MVKSWLLLIIASLICFAASTPVYETNAQRFARGLPPAPPKFMRDLALRKGRIGTPVLRSRNPLTSPLPPVTLNGKLQIRSQSGTSMGNIRNWSGSGSISGLNFLGPDEDLLVRLSYSPTYTSKLSILTTNPAFPAPLYVGAAISSSSVVSGFSSTTSNSMGFTNDDLTSAGAGPAKSSAGDAYVESAIWSFDPSTHKLTAQWINADSTTPPTILAYDVRWNALFFVSDITKYNSQSTYPASAVDLFFIPA
ncbi:hypothetical protein D9613_006967 [Agrocybe pediades]|uniref:Uncharacterized protein n=1 Tax=Agrocybe pediades TaxID=84607 RepID=A0A8H4QH64_9AGAR|nr:hypothetical protein D9613_006967 [Agrocybe pediades]